MRDERWASQGGWKRSLALAAKKREEISGHRDIFFDDDDTFVFPEGVTLKGE